MTTSSPWTLGITETRKSTVRGASPAAPGTIARNRPSWGTRRSATSSSAITFSRAAMVAWKAELTASIAG